MNISKLQLIGINGYAGAGKDTVAQYIGTRYQTTYIESFAGALKEACSAAFGIPREAFIDPALKDSINKYWGLSPREILQFMGTEIFRGEVSSFVGVPEGDFWLQRMHGRLTGKLICENVDGVYEPGDTIIIPDVRFQNEYEYITQNGGWVIHLTRPGHEGNVGILDHASEDGIEVTDPAKTYQISNNSTLEKLYEKVEAFIAHAELDFTIAETL